jgi:ribose transport system permease protein
LIVNAVLSTGFFTEAQLTPLIGGGACLVILAMASTVPMLVGNGGIDISVGPLAGLVNVVVVVIAASHTINGSAWVVVPLSVAMGLASGALVGFLIGYLRLQPIVVTLGAYLIYTALAQVVLQNQSGNGPSWLAHLGGNVGPVPGGALFIAVAACFWIAVGRTGYHRLLYMVGDNDAAAYTSGVPVERVRMGAYMISGVMAAIAGLAITAYLNAGDAQLGETLALTAIAGAALGGTSLAGGRGGVFGGFAGGVAVYLIQNVLSVVGIGSYWITFSFGAVLILGIALNGLISSGPVRGTSA